MNIEKMKETTMTCLKVIFFTLYLKYKIWNPELKKMTYSQLHDEIMAIFLAGHETTSNALTWTFYLLSKHPLNIKIKKFFIKIKIIKTFLHE